MRLDRSENFFKKISLPELELGAAQGYFSFRIASDYPLARCIMVDSNTKHYPYHGDMLCDLHQLNSHLSNVFCFKKQIDLSDL